MALSLEETDKLIERKYESAVLLFAFLGKVMFHFGKCKDREKG